MRAVVVTGPSAVDLVDTPAPTLEDDSVLVEPSLIGICGTDLHIFTGDYPVARYPLIPGHELIGTITEVGAAASGLHAGDRVVVDPGLPCGSCRECARELPNLCANRRAIGVSLPGGAADLVAVPAKNCHVLPDSVSDSAAVLAEPLACVVHAFDMVPRVAGADVAVYGAGTIGALCVQVAKHAGAASVTVIDSNTARAEAALGRGADVALKAATDAGPDPRWDVVLDATGVPAAVQDGLSRVGRGGTFVQVGVVPSDAQVTISPYDIYLREIRIQGSMTTRDSFPRAIDLLADGAVDTAGMTSDPFRLADYEVALRAAMAGEHLKVVIDPRR